MIALSTISMTAIEPVSDASAIGMTAAMVNPARAGQRVAEEERQGDRQRDGLEVREAERGADHHGRRLPWNRQLVYPPRVLLT
jgi:hypothetical protein